MSAISVSKHRNCQSTFELYMYMDPKYSLNGVHCTLPFRHPGAATTSSVTVAVFNCVVEIS